MTTSNYMKGRCFECSSTLRTRGRASFTHQPPDDVEWCDYCRQPSSDRPLPLDALTAAPDNSDIGYLRAVQEC